MRKSFTLLIPILTDFIWFHRNFRKNSSHVLLLMVRAKDRLPKYALFGWGAPLVFIFICIMLDVFLKSSLSSFRPCYAGYLEGCIKYQTVDLKNIHSVDNSTHLNNTTESFDSMHNSTCYSDRSNIFHVAILTRTCWISHGNANLVYFGLPIAVIIIVNAVLFFLTIYNIRQMKSKQKKNQIRRFSRVKIPGDKDVKFYVQMAFLMGFTWIIGFFLTTFSSENVVILKILVYLFILSNASIGVFIFFVFIFKKETLILYKILTKRIFKRFQKNKEFKKSNLPLSHQSSSSSKTTETTSTSSKSMISNDGSFKKSEISEPSAKSVDQINTIENYLDASNIAYIDEA